MNKNFLVEVLEDGDMIPVGCADSLCNAMILLNGRAGRVSTFKSEFLFFSHNGGKNV